ncbi:hypothetical protein ASF92_09665 [Pedobacter sp. Leaf176]|nr:hypothetical protein ASF92_09665 [Pedobacter sp. Leaf176]
MLSAPCYRPSRFSQEKARKSLQFLKLPHDPRQNQAGPSRFSQEKARKSLQFLKLPHDPRQNQAGAMG